MIRRLTGLVLLLALFLSTSCGLSGASRLKQRAHEYFTAWKFKDYETMYSYLNQWGREHISKDTFVEFMAAVDTARDIYVPEDLEADYLREMKTGGVDTFKIEDAYIQSGRGKVRLFLKTSRDLVGQSLIDPNPWVYEDGQWRVEVTPQGPLFSNIQRWQLRTGREASAPSIQPEVGLSGQIQIVRAMFQELERKISDYFQEHGKYPRSLDELPEGKHYRDPFNAGAQLRYGTDEHTFWIVASHGPDGKADIDVQRFKGLRDGYPPAALVYDPSTGKGDLYDFGPKR